MNNKDVVDLINKIGDIPKEEQFSNADLFEDKLVGRYKRKGVTLKLHTTESQIGGNYDSFVVESAVSLNMANIDKMDKQIYNLSRTVLEKGGVDSFLILQKLEDYIFHKFNFIPKHVFLVGSKLTIDRWKYQTLNFYKNSLPDGLKAKNIYVNVQIPYPAYIKNITDIGQYIQTILGYLEDGGTCILSVPLTFNNKTFYELFKTICGQFKDITLYYPTLFRKINSEGFIILSGKSSGRSLVNTGGLTKFYKYLLENVYFEMQLYAKLLQIKYDNDILFNILYNKFYSRSYLNLLLDR